ncbi:tail fiber domain-containing protein [Klebsiella sp. S69]|uniref:tail fiber domain-containing protein n=1 Tax=Klebsiella sp. S69 TaxID=2767439 RepID=UPI001902F712|nr:tail fiber domain-containing protein [Klebsiella sp. S69]MBK0167078.1 tail fiber domain-containing protein [Klebsiella sp. S69]
MAEQKKNALILNGINDDITELKSLTTLRKRVVSDGEIVSKGVNGFRLAGANTGVILRNDGKNFNFLTTADGQARDGAFNTLRPFAFSLTTGRVSLRNGVDISGGALVSHNAGITAQTTGPDPLIKGQEYNAPEIATQFTTGKKTVRMLMGARVNAAREDFGLLSYRDWQGNWNELRLRSGATLDAGQYVKRNPDGWYKAQGNRPVDNNKANKTNGLWLQGAGNLSADFYHYERIGQHHFLGLHVANGGAQGWYEFRNDGHAYTNGAWNSSSDARMKTDIEKIDNALDRLDSIGGYTYLKQGVPEAGVIAQEVEQVLPQSVTQTELILNDGSVLPDARSININGVVALLVEALKEERQARLEDQAQLRKEQEARQELEQRLAALERRNGQEAGL